MNRGEIFETIFVLFFLLSILFFIGKGYMECDSSGGKYVRGVFWYECIKEDSK